MVGRVPLRLVSGLRGQLIDGSESRCSATSVLGADERMRVGGLIRGGRALPSVRLLRRRLSAGDSHFQAQLATVPTPFESTWGLPRGACGQH